MTRPLNPEIQRRMEAHRRDYEQVTGRAFKHFFCPILAVDEPADFIRGHVINKAYEGSPSTWVVQRADVDNFFGTYFESEFETLQHRSRATPAALLTDKELGKKFRPMILLDGDPVIHTSQPNPPPEHFVRAVIGDGPDAPAFGIKMSKDEMAASAGGKWEFVVFKDARIHALVSLIKAAHLTLFHLFGYRYALSSAGLFVGSDILGRFYQSNRRRPKLEILANAWAYFRESKNMVHLLMGKPGGFEGTVRDRKLFVCHGSSGMIWAHIVFVNTAGRLNAVMMPAFNTADSAGVFLDFLSNDHETIQVSTAEFDRENQRWTISHDRAEQRWPKKGLIYPDSAEPLLFPPEEILPRRRS